VSHINSYHFQRAGAVERIVDDRFVMERAYTGARQLERVRVSVDGRLVCTGAVEYDAVWRVTRLRIKIDGDAARDADEVCVCVFACTHTNLICSRATTTPTAY
jgi:hypothetical protein